MILISIHLMPSSLLIHVKMGCIFLNSVDQSQFARTCFLSIQDLPCEYC